MDEDCLPGVCCFTTKRRTIHPQWTSNTSQLVTIASTFVTLNDARHQADYDTSIIFSHIDANTYVGSAESAFTDWAFIQADPATETFLAELWCRGIPKR